MCWFLLQLLMRWNLFCDSPYKLFAFFTLNLISFKLRSSLISHTHPPSNTNSTFDITGLRSQHRFLTVLSDLIERHFFSWSIKPLDFLLEFDCVKAPFYLLFPEPSFLMPYKFILQTYYLHLACVLRRCNICLLIPSLQVLIFFFSFPLTLKFTVGPKGKQLEGTECPLHVVHPPTGEEFALGCGVCRNAHTF